jgi:hypothetical protein
VDLSVLDAESLAEAEASPRLRRIK